jgi:hypothetical protein
LSTLHSAWLSGTVQPNLCYIFDTQAANSARSVSPTPGADFFDLSQSCIEVFSTP